MVWPWGGCSWMECNTTNKPHRRNAFDPTKNITPVNIGNCLCRCGLARADFWDAKTPPTPVNPVQHPNTARASPHLQRHRLTPGNAQTNIQIPRGQARTYKDIASHPATPKRISDNLFSTQDLLIQFN